MNYLRGMESFKEIIQGSKPTLVDFFATWCGPCKAMTPVIDQLKNEMGDKVRVIKIDVDKNQKVAAQFQVRGVPTFVLFKEGKIVWRQSGGMSISTLKTQIEQFSE